MIFVNFAAIFAKNFSIAMDTLQLHQNILINDKLLRGAVMTCKPISNVQNLKSYLYGEALVAFNFETTPYEKYPKEENGAPDAHNSPIGRGHMR